MSKTSVVLAALVACGLSLAAQAAPDLRVPEILYEFTGTPDGMNPVGGVVLDGAYYGVTNFGGANNTGCLYKTDLKTKTHTVLHSFPPSGLSAQPSGDFLVIGKTLYATTRASGTYNLGTIYAFDTTSNTTTVLYDFAGGNVPSGEQADGVAPTGVIAIDGKFYGLAQGGGHESYGTLFEFDPATGKETTLYQFFNRLDGYIGTPVGPLAQIGGLLYGAATSGGSFHNGAVFSFDPKTNRERTLYSFDGTTDNFGPQTGLTVAAGRLYGVLGYGGRLQNGLVYSIDPATGAETVVHEFAAGVDGSVPSGQLRLVGGKLFGVYSFNGPLGKGGVYAIDVASGKESTVAAFTGFDGGYAPNSRLAVGNGKLYGTTFWGGLGDGVNDANGKGTMYQLVK